MVCDLKLCYYYCYSNLQEIFYIRQQGREGIQVPRRLTTLLGDGVFLRRDIGMYLTQLRLL